MCFADGMLGANDAINPVARTGIQHLFEQSSHMYLHAKDMFVVEMWVCIHMPSFPNPTKSLYM